MNSIENLSVTGALNITLVKEDGSVQTVDTKNLVVSTGLNFIVSRMKDATATVMSNMALGTGTTAAALADTTLTTEISGSRVALTSTTVTANQIVYVASFAAGVGTGAVTEAGIFNASTGGTMLCHTVFPVVNKQAGDSMTVTWTVSVN
jgi:predicted ribonuclease toxin of YeeF-YezG toxin-antitoxin module